MEFFFFLNIVGVERLVKFNINKIWLDLCNLGKEVGYVY